MFPEAGGKLEGDLTRVSWKDFDGREAGLTLQTVVYGIEVIALFSVGLNSMFNESHNCGIVRRYSSLVLGNRQLRTLENGAAMMA